MAQDETLRELEREVRATPTSATWERYAAALARVGETAASEDAALESVRLDLHSGAARFLPGQAWDMLVRHSRCDGVARGRAMKAFRAHTFGGPEVLELDEIPKPSPGPGEALVRVTATSVNPIDWKLREGYFKDLPLPFTPGGDFSGNVAELGKNVLMFKVGDAVHGVAPNSTGAAAEFVVVPVDTIAPRPATLDFEQAAAVPLASMTAWQGLFDQGHLAAGEHVLILGASGAVGSFAVQFAKLARTRVSGTASTENVPHVRFLGADLVIDYEKEQLRDKVREISLCLDLVGGKLAKEALEVMRSGGRFVSTVEPPDEAIARSRNVTATVFRMKPRGNLLRQIGKLIDEGKVKLDVARVLPFEQLREAEELNRRRQVSGKIVLRVAA